MSAPLIRGSDGRPANGYSKMRKPRSEPSPDQVCHRRPDPRPALTSTERVHPADEANLSISLPMGWE
jgi:hypothetical protein